MSSSHSTDAVAKVRRAISHPVIDSDGHLIEYVPIVRDFVVEIAGEDVAKRFDRMFQAGSFRRAIPDRRERRKVGLHAIGIWGIPTENTLDRATAMLPGLMYERLDELGIDYAILYPTYGLAVTALDDAEVRCAMARAFNRYYAEAYQGFRDRLEPVAAIPTFTPEEAIAELDYAVGTLGLKSVMLGGAIPRRIDPNDTRPGQAQWIDTLGHDSLHDYDPFWRRCEALGVAPTFHAGGQGFGTRMSTTNNSYNQVGNFAAAGEGTCRSLVFGGVAMRFPKLRFAFQEGGVAWAAVLLAGLLGHYEKRNIDAIQHYDPARLDRARLASLFEKHARGRMRETMDRLGDALSGLSDPNEDLPRVDMFGESQIRSAEDLLRMFQEQFFFGCEADDPMNAIAFSPSLTPGGVKLPAVFASDVGHWDVRDMREVLPEAWELVEEGRIDEGQFEDFVFGNPVRLWAGTNPRFFEGTVVGEAVTKRLAGR
ncbi:MAG: amidohydrolase family protein [Deltaproteobacteria bacterium]|nr:amidohydrolase family protein [Deltaproteobacteria bacterium]